MRIRNPYKVLRVSRDADEAAIEEAYDSLYDRYEPEAQAGDSEAIAVLEELNEAHDLLMDPDRRAAIDAKLSSPAGPSGGQRAGTATATRAEVKAKPRPRTDSTTWQPKRSAASRRPRSVPRRQSSSTVPWVVGGILVFAALAAAVYFIGRAQSGGSGNLGGNAGEVVATVNGQPIYRQDYEAQVAKDLDQQMSEPIIAGMINQGGDTAKRVIDVINQDALDKLINMEVIQQQARKENLYPDEKAAQDLVAQAKATDLKGKPFDQFLKETGLTEERYRQNVVRNVVYALMANKYTPSEGDASKRENDFITWMCKTRTEYTVKINLKFSVENKECTSGLPSSVPLPGGEGPAPPEPEPTGEVPIPK